MLFSKISRRFANVHKFDSFKKFKAHMDVN